MSFGYIALALVSVGTAAYSADAARKGQHQVADAQAAADEKDAQQKAELETSTAVAANAKFAADKRARQANILGLGGGPSPLGDGPLGGPVGSGIPQSAISPNVLSTGAPAGGGTVGGIAPSRATIKPVRNGPSAY